MEKSTQTDKKLEWHVVILGLALFLGSILRIFPGAMTGFPLNDGGMFYVMINDLRSNHYLLPDFTTYNFLDIPFAYSPFGFYLVAVIQDGIGLSVFESLRWLPVIANVISIYALYLLAILILNERSRAAIASAFYALTPGSYDWFIMGGGLTRSFGYLFLLLSLYFIVRTFQNGTLKNVLLTTLFCALTVLGHPEAALHLTASCLLFWLFLGRTKQGTLNAIFIGLGTIVLTSPWWLTLLARHGTGPVISALHTGMYHRNPIVALLNNIFALDTYIPILMILRVIGLGWAIWKRQFLLPAWLALPYFVEPRSAPVVTFFSFCMLIALALADALPALARWLKRKKVVGIISPQFIELRWLNRMIFLLLIYLFVESSLLSFRLINTTLKLPEIEAMTWVKDNTPKDARFLVITGNPDAMVDPMQEWFPALAGRRSQTTLQGLEWTLAGEFFSRFDDLTQLQRCEQMMCIEDWSKETGIEFTHLLIDTRDLPDGRFDSLQEDFELMYESRDISIYQK
jgi:hypothetical protein